MKKRLLLLIILITSSNTFSQITFQDHIIIDNSLAADGASSIFAIDIDNDGDIDMLSASEYDDKIAWYENEDGLGNFGTQKIISANADGASSVYATDLDGDGDIDVLSASNTDNKIAWYENEDGLGNFSTEKNIVTNNVLGISTVYAADMDGDGDKDVLCAAFSGNNLVWFENTNGLGNFDIQRNISTSQIATSTIYTADIDNDGDLDVISASEGNTKRLVWYENIDGLGNFSTLKIISTSSTGKSVFATDIDGDGDIDVLTDHSGNASAAWYENTDGLGNFGSAKIIPTSTGGSVDNKIYATDIDNDGDIDVLLAAIYSQRIVWHENTDGNGTFSSEKIITTKIRWPNSVYAADIDNDGDLDVLSASRDDDKLAWYKNEDGLGDFGIQNTITLNASGAISVYASDFDGDGDKDIISASENDHRIAWYENIDGLGAYGKQQIISSNIAIAPQSVYATDIDSDGDMDILTASWSDQKIAWYENSDSMGNFTSEKTITTNADGANSVFASDIDDDGDMDVLSASWGGDKIEWYENNDSMGNFGTEQIITSDADGATSVLTIDIDNDGDLDVLSSSYYKIVWSKNIDGLGTFTTQTAITTDVDIAESVYAADLDGDGDMDVLSASWGDDKIAWYENTDGLGSYSSQKIISVLADGAGSVYAADMDGDGDMDVLSTSASDDKIVWYENLNVNLSVNQYMHFGFSIYPNPIENVLTVETQEVIIQIEIYNLLGQLVLKNTNRDNINITNLNKGLYYCRIKNKDGNYGTKKIIKK